MYCLASNCTASVPPCFFQAVLQSRPRPPAGFADPDAPKELLLAPGSKVVWLGQHYFGCLGTVLADPAAVVTGNSRITGYIVRVQVRMGGGGGHGVERVAH